MLARLLLALMTTTAPAPLRVIDIAPAWSGHPVGFAIVTHGDRQFVGFYDAERRLTIASRTLDSQQWTFKVLPTSVGWDSHNYIEMAIDDGGYIHVAGNMHAAPLVYFRSTRPLEIQSLERVGAMVGTQENRCTYPRFFRGPANELIFAYRDGASGNGNQIHNVYDHKTRAWHRLLDQPLTDGQGLVNAYIHGPVRGPDGYFHICWVWRDDPGCETNHDLSYARSKDLRHWEESDGTPIALPMTMRNCEVVDPVPAGGGIINGNTVIGFDSHKRVIVSYHKFDAAGNTQIYSARREATGWKIYQTSDWNYRWDFRGGGTIPFEITLGGVSANGKGALTQLFTHIKYGQHVWTLDENTLKPILMSDPPPAHPNELDRVESDFPGMQVRWKRAGRFELRWETLGINRDRSRESPLPPPSMLRLYEWPMR
jgi:hypothetical protein